MADAQEEHYVLRVMPPDLAAKLRAWLREERGLDGRAELLFEGARCVVWCAVFVFARLLPAAACCCLWHHPPHRLVAQTRLNLIISPSTHH